MANPAMSMRPTPDQLSTLLNFMQNHQNLAWGRMKGLDDRAESKKLWLQLTKLLNNMDGPTRSLKSWMKFWADKKSMVKAKVKAHGNTNSLAHVEMKIYDICFSTDSSTGGRKPVKKAAPKKKSTVKLETNNHNDDDFDFNNDGSDSDESVNNMRNRRHNEMVDKLMRVMDSQVDNMSRLTDAYMMNSHALNRISEASQAQARALEVLNQSFGTMSAAAMDIRNAVIDMDLTMKRFYNATAT